MKMTDGDDGPQRDADAARFRAELAGVITPRSERGMKEPTETVQNKKREVE